ncbi:ubiquitin conjugating enzyme [Ascobolus immersus RN42]|uniref:E2 ubiquitin-conjugating enzyme n=1 Tax=Ascobolus immersus RN42 TaxID=1160509 RepID=A0A3N4HQ09_ASCIM|nr:ubiquitin conjugating enzyme [Ascobolus immersus RN42]
MSRSGAEKRIMRELADIQKAPIAGISAGPISDNELLKWQAVIVGPEGSPYAGGIFKLKIDLPLTPTSYPFAPPTFIFETKIYHPNVSDDGKMCLAPLRSDNWKPASKLVDLLRVVQNVLLEPILEDAINTAAAEQYKSDRAGFDKVARDWTAKHANK